MSTTTQINDQKIIAPGFSLIELMIAMLLGTLALGTLLTVFASTVSTNKTILENIHLHQELRIILDIMTRDIRRTGYWAHAENSPINTPNPFGIVELTDTCIRYSYDIDKDGQLNSNKDIFGFRLNKQTIEVSINGRKCNQNRWEDLTDLNTLTIKHTETRKEKTPIFQLNTECLNITQTGDKTCTKTAPGDLLIQSSTLLINLTGMLKKDPEAEFSLASSITLPNHQVLIH